jgi:hypothetical protein
MDHLPHCSSAPVAHHRTIASEHRSHFPGAQRDDRAHLINADMNGPKLAGLQAVIHHVQRNTRVHQLNPGHYAMLPGSDRGDNVIGARLGHSTPPVRGPDRWPEIPGIAMAVRADGKAKAWANRYTSSSTCSHGMR